MTTTLIGIGLCLFGGIFVSLGVNIQKLSHRNQTTYLWYLGLISMIFGSACDAYSTQFTSHSILAPISSFSLIFNIGFACYLNEEVLTIHMFFGTCLIMLGSVLCVLSGKQINQMSTPDVFLSGRYISYNLILIISLTSFRWIQLSYPEIFYSFMSGIFGSQNAVYSKIMLDMISIQQFYTHYAFYLSVVCLCVCISIHLYWLNEGLKHYPSMTIIPISKAFGIIYTVIAGIVIYSEYTNLHLFAGFLLGLSVICNGLIFFAITEES